MTKIEAHQLIAHLHGITDSSAKVTADSRQVKKGDIFFAYPVGQAIGLSDGREFIDDALQRGAGAVVFDPVGMSDEYLENPKCFAISGLAALAGKLCAEWYENPSSHLKVIGVTGTNGKTTITQWVLQALDEAKHPCAVIGTLGTGFPGHLLQTGYTTPDAPRLQSQLQELRNAGAKTVVMEISSHALDQARTSGVDINCAVFTNLTQDHLDYHGSMTEYAAAKAKLFQSENLEHAVLNLDDAFGRELAVQLVSKKHIKVWGYALSKKAFAGFEKFGNRLQQIYVKDSIFTAAGYDAVFDYEGVGSTPIQLATLGEFNLSNALAVWTILLTQGFNCNDATQRMSKLRPVSGRMELIQLNKTARTDGPIVVVDYAHTPDALEKALIALRPLAMTRQGQIWCVFGCGGDRDVSKRPEMGRVAQNFSDQIIITSDNPRSEKPEAIIAMIRAGISIDAQNIQLIPDRAAAIMAAVRNALVQDVILVAGKGHESTQEINGKKFAFSDQEHIQLAAGGGM
jgi:UDP-N-acetylmuramoyl-L-alanyl-D-glutamate--2,6-diaminopimelate ligase